MAIFRILFIGDIVGKPGRAAVAQVLPQLKKEEKIDLVIANVENLAHGKGLTKKTWEEVQRAGVDLGTSGNHVLSKDDAREILSDAESHVVRPANYPADTPGVGAKIFSIAGKRVLLVNLSGTAFMAYEPTSPFTKTDEILTTFPEHDIAIVDLHGEATSEKVALGWYLDGRVTLVVGTHTHVPTADARVLLHGTGYVTDLGMCGLRDGIIGVDRDAIMPRFLENKKLPHEIAEHGPATFCSILVEVDEQNHTTSVTRVDRECEV
jgi:2',3'-cyclic-nucleotide 2'-phosphodiesterase